MHSLVSPPPKKNTIKEKKGNQKGERSPVVSIWPKLSDKKSLWKKMTEDRAASSHGQSWYLSVPLEGGAVFFLKRPWPSSPTSHVLLVQ